MTINQKQVILTILLCIGIVCVFPVFGDTSAHTITDMSGSEITVPTDIERIVIACQGGVAQEIAILGNPDSLVAMDSTYLFPIFAKMFPHFKEVPNPGGFDDLNMETILKLKPDVVINSITSSKGNAKLTENNIPVFQAYTGKATSDNIYNEFRAFGELLNNTKKSEELISYWDEKKQFISDRMKDIPENERKTVFYDSNFASNKKLVTGIPWGISFVELSGGINVARDLDDATFNPEINPEQLAEWDPDVIILRRCTDGTYPDEEIKNNPQLSGLSAIKNDEIYKVPFGGFWWDCPSPEWPLGYLWLSKTLYPDTFEDVDMVNEMKYFFKEFYRYDLSDEEANEILSVNN